MPVLSGNEPILKLKPHSHPHRPRFKRARWRKKAAQTRWREIHKLGAEVEDRRIEWIENFKLRCEAAMLSQTERPRGAQIEYPLRGAAPSIAREIAARADGWK